MKRVFVLGDSISIQYGPYLEAGLDGVMRYSRKEGQDPSLQGSVAASEALLNLDNPMGANGGDSSMALAYLRGRLAAGGIAADVLLLNCGLHDIKTDLVTGQKQVPLARYRENLASILDVVGRLGLQCVWVRTTPVDDAVHNSLAEGFHRHAADGDAYNAAADEIMAAAGVASIDLHAFTANLDDDLYCDHIHFNEPVCRKQGAYIADWLSARF